MIHSVVTNLDSLTTAPITIPAIAPDERPELEDVLVCARACATFNTRIWLKDSVNLDIRSVVIIFKLMVFSQRPRLNFNGMSSDIFNIYERAGENT